MGPKELNNFHAIIFRVKIFSYASRPYENILTTKFFYNENLDHKVAQHILASNAAVGRSNHWNGIMYSQLQRYVGEVYNAAGIPTTRRIDTKERSCRRLSDFYPREK